ncbi:MULTISPECIES: glycine--tRNA ligase subunit beta [unclassified Polaromonas]|jgi:glycyl-tRNA synthetase beta chain|uniref:glycine--tRNA ligase subunit beta n=1 Tax=unclassified Polaromonas TaxID=2638319 RepID=UPI000BCD7E08|nr:MULTISPECIES: glycine--tRNA ligase subunit beta [unclassified Polaromonas]OYY35726.1 MAG: glycine--tRNA ligase subunit beta [Polaromonas sp. 35-63-35]OYZ19971.1 MAG: glycine--tRNA ligase subunit beta [Polaromonas sp. 16-63-31]OYZ76845.1 MAG: glycine--tRNA ligase subunit beta [Polaromonas sp. 24-63-21]OZA51880.1 MAG: glycine--tRNA ligase subunit beta [Polaromonas sp. 17-63-33]OZA88088.1 MAG: glycine--tRNA ligase subunit beta [Polaromonas sp. 39-63-25]
MTTQNLLVELFVEELPPKALKKLGEAFAGVLFEQLKAQGLASADTSVVTAYASPRRLAAHVTHVWRKAADKAVQQKLMPVSVGLDASGNATPALLKKLQALGADVSDPAAAVAALKRAPDGKAEALFYDSLVTGATLDTGLQKALEEAIAKLPIPKVMSYQLETDCALPGWSSVNFVRPAHGLVALHGSTVVPITALGLKAGNTTQGHRFEAKVSPVVIKDADAYAQTLLSDGAVIASFDDRRFAIVQQLAQAAERLGPGYEVLMDEDLLSEVTGLVEHPNVLVCAFESQFLDVPQECLILTMKANQKYFPLVDAKGKLTNKFLVVSNISPDDASAVIGGNERVVRPRLADAKFFFDQDRKKTLASRVAGLDKVVYHNKLGSQGERVQRVRTIAEAIANRLNANVADVQRAAELAKTDLVTDMVGEFPELQGIMGRYYALNDGLSAEVADAIEDHYKPRFAGDELPRNTIGVMVALADKLETLVGMFGIGNLPTGDKDPFALRRHALGVIRMLVEKDLPLGLAELVEDATPVFGDKITNASAALTDFIYDRLAGSLREQGFSAQEVEAVLALRPQRLGDVAKRLAAVRAFAALPEAPALAAANKRISNILKKAQDVDAHVSEVLLKEPAEVALYAAMQELAPKANSQFEAGDYTASLQTLAALRAPVDAFFDGVMVNAEEMDLRLNRQGLLKSLHDAMNRVADLSKLAS